MHASDVFVPHLTTAHQGPLYPVESHILNQIAPIESWFREQWLKTPPSITSSVDLRHAGFKLAPVDTNLFPAGFNNLNRDFLPLCVQAIQVVIMELLPACKTILLIPESHTRNQFYLESLFTLREIFTQAGFVLRIGSLDPELKQAQAFTLSLGSLLIEPLIRNGNRVGLADFDPCMVLLNNDLSLGFPALLKDIEQPIHPTPILGWFNRLKSEHFQFFNEVVDEFCQLTKLDPWLINPYFTYVKDLDFMSGEGMETLAAKADELLAQIAAKYKHYGIFKPPFVVVKADNGTYGMSVIMVHEGAALKELNRKQRTRMAASKGGRKVNQVIIQEGVYTFETMPSGAVAEPVVYMIGQFVIGGFYRVHQQRQANENLNAPGMHFEPLAFAKACNTPQKNLAAMDCPNRFYAYGVIARLAALAAAREIAFINH